MRAIMKRQLLHTPEGVRDIYNDECEKKMLQRMEEIDGIVLACRERMMEQAGNDSLKL